MSSGAVSRKYLRSRCSERTRNTAISVGPASRQLRSQQRHRGMADQLAAATHEPPIGPNGRYQPVRGPLPTSPPAPLASPPSPRLPKLFAPFDSSGLVPTSPPLSPSPQPGLLELCLRSKSWTTNPLLYLLSIHVFLCHSSTSPHSLYPGLQEIN